MDEILISEHYPNSKITKSFLGNNGTVYILNDKIAVKILHKSSWAKPSDIANEAEVQQKAHTLGVAPRVFKVDPENGLMSSEYIKGDTLDEYLVEHPDEIIDIKKQVKGVLDKLYDNGIIHGDLAGSNFIISEGLFGNKIYAVDFSTGVDKGESIPEKKRDYYITGQMEHMFGRKRKSKSKKRSRRKSRGRKKSTKSRGRKKRRSRKKLKYF